MTEQKAIEWTAPGALSFRLHVETWDGLGPHQQRLATSEDLAAALRVICGRNFDEYLRILPNLAPSSEEKRLAKAESECSRLRTELEWLAGYVLREKYALPHGPARTEAIRRAAAALGTPEAKP